MDKTLVAASGNKHDYYSFPPYWWPNPDTQDGLPYIRKDGQTNPDANSDATDKNRLVKMSNDGQRWRWRGTSLTTIATRKRRRRS